MFLLAVLGLASSQLTLITVAGLKTLLKLRGHRLDFVPGGPDGHPHGSLGE